jgi:hypothetical protein
VILLPLEMRGSLTPSTTYPTAAQGYTPPSLSADAIGCGEPLRISQRDGPVPASNLPSELLVQTCYDARTSPVVGASLNELSALRLDDDGADLAAALDLLVGRRGIVERETGGH